VTTRWIAALLIAAVLAGCSDKPGSTPLPTKQTTIDPVKKRLDDASALEEARRAKMEEETK
jgi:hypothetical protein